MLNTIVLLFVILVTASGCGKEPQVIAGPQGNAGSQGQPGFSSLVVIANDAPSCSNGGKTILTALDVNYSNTIDAGDVNLQTAEICHGTDAASSPFSPAEFIDPCGDAPGVYDEVLIKLANGMIVASFSDNANGKNTRLSVLVPANYVTTDGSNCSFSVDAAGAVTW